MTEHTSGDPNALDRLVRLDDGDTHVVEEGNRDADDAAGESADRSGVRYSNGGTG